MTFGQEVPWGASVTESTAMVDRYRALGGNFIDTANAYTRGHSEAILGDYLAEDRSRRARLVLSTKFSMNLSPGDPNGGGSSRKSIIAACEQSLRRLRTDYIDVYWLHNWDKHTPIEETMACLESLVQSGKVRYIGVSDTPAWKIAQAQMISQFRGWAPFVGLQIEYSLLERTSECELIPMAEELGLGVMPWSPLRNGLLTGKYTRDAPDAVGSGRMPLLSGQLGNAAYDVIDLLTRIAHEMETSIARVALAWVRGRRGVTSTIIGARTVAQLEDNIRSLEVELGPEQLRRLDELTAPALPFPHNFLQNAPALHSAGATVNGERSEPYRFGPSHIGDHY
jgi:aryl-alcohol dehydrogenase-like predicted oxidoreductase